MRHVKLKDLVAGIHSNRLVDAISDSFQPSERDHYREEATSIDFWMIVSLCRHHLELQEIILRSAGAICVVALPNKGTWMGGLRWRMWLTLNNLWYIYITDALWSLFEALPSSGNKELPLMIWSAQGRFSSSRVAETGLEYQCVKQDILRDIGPSVSLLVITRFLGLYPSNLETRPKYSTESAPLESHSIFSTNPFWSTSNL